MKLEKRHKILLTLVIIVIAFIGWQLYDNIFANNVSSNKIASSFSTFSSAPKSADSSSAIAIPPIKSEPSPTMASTQPITPPAPVTTSIETPAVKSSSSTPSAPAPVPTTTVSQPMKENAMIPMPMPFLSPIQTMTGSEKEAYNKLNNKYQMIKIQRQLIDEQGRMIAARLRLSRLSQLMAKISGEQPLCGTAVIALNNMTPIGYQLIYIGFQNNQAVATLLTKTNQIIDVTPGLILADKSKILKINPDNIIIQQETNTYLLNFLGATLIKPVVPMPMKSILPVSKKAMSTVTIIKPAPKEKLIKKRPAPSRKVTTSAKTSTSIKKIVTVASPRPTVAIIQKNSTPMITTAAASSPPSLPPSVTVVNRNADIATNRNRVLPVNNNITAITPAPVPMALAVNKNDNSQAPISPSKLTNMASNSKTTGVSIPLMNPETTHNPPPLISKPKQPLMLTAQQKDTVNQLENSLNPEKPVTRNHSKDEQHLLTLPKNYYTLQIYGSRKLLDLSDLVKKNKLENSTYIFHTYYLGKDWYVLIYGVYKTEQEALDTVKVLPAAIRSLRPWVRTLGSVQDAIKS